MRHLKYLLLILALNLPALAALPPKPLPGLPVGAASGTNSSDSLIFVNTAQSNLAYRLYLWDLINLPPFASSTYVLSKTLSGFSAGAGTVTSSDTVKTALEKLAGNSTPGAPISIGTFDSQTPDAKGLSLVSNVLYGQSASAINPGMVNTASQTFAGAKTFNGGMVGNLTGNVTGNSDTSSALAANPADCASNTYATTIAANGDLSCSSVSDSGLATSYLKADGSRSLSADWNAGAHNITTTTFIGALTGNASTSSALAANPLDCASNTFANTIAANGDLTCAAVGDSALSTSYLKADGSRGLSADWNAGAHNLTATTFIGALTGNSSTSSALASNPSDCASNTYATTIAANGDLSCSSVSDSGLATSYLKADGSRGLSGNWNAGAFSITATTFVGGLTGNASTATALAANPSPCSAGDFVTDIAADGTLTCDTPAGGGGGGLNTARFVLDGAIAPGFTSINGPEYVTGTQSLTEVNISALNSGSNGSTVVQLNQYRAGALQATATASLNASSSLPNGATAALSGTLSLLSGDIITVDVVSVASGSPSDLTVEWGTVAAVTGGTTLNIVTKTSGYTLDNSDDTVIFNCSADCTLTLQTSASATNKIYRIKNISAYVLTIARASSDTFEDGSTSVTINPGSPIKPAVELQPDGGTQWYIF